MDIKEVKAWRMNPLLCVSGHTLDVMDWLISEHDRLAAANKTTREALERIAYPQDDVDSDIPPFYIAREALKEYE